MLKICKFENNILFSRNNILLHKKYHIILLPTFLVTYVCTYRCICCCAKGNHKCISPHMKTNMFMAMLLLKLICVYLMFAYVKLNATTNEFVMFGSE